MLLQEGSRGASARPPVEYGEHTRKAVLWQNILSPERNPSLWSHPSLCILEKEWDHCGQPTDLTT